MHDRLRVLMVGDRQPATVLEPLRAAGVVNSVEIAETPAEAGRGAAAADLALVVGQDASRAGLAGLRALRTQDPYLPAVAVVDGAGPPGLADAYERAGASEVVWTSRLHELPDVARRQLLAAGPLRAERRLADERAALRQLMEVVGADDLDGGFDVAARQALTLAAADVAGVYRVQAGQAALVVGTSLDGRPVPEAPAADHETGAVAEAPIVADGRRWGVLWVAAYSPRALPADAGERLAGLAGLLALTVRSTRIRAELEAQAATDPLTGLANRRTFEERLGHEFARARRHGRRLALVIIDIDNFKALNDSAGHQAGDRALAEVARRLSAAARGGDLVARLGGDEFAWLIPEAGGWSALQAADRAREAILCEPLVDGAYLSASAGVAEIGHTPDPAELTRWADQALYQAKRHGRDVAFLYSPERAEPMASGRGASRVDDAHGVRVLARAAASRSSFPKGHAERVAAVAAAIARQLGWGASQCGVLREAGTVHDIGLVAVPEHLIGTSSLTDAERDQVEAHAEIGAALVGPVLRTEHAAWVRSHHERWDGLGYPDGAEGEDIPEGARILAVAIAYAEASSPPPPGRGLDPDDALAAVLAESGAALWPAAVEALAVLSAAGATPLAAAPTAGDDL